MKKSLAVVGRIIETAAIPGVKLAIQAVVECGASGKWSGVVSNEMQVGDLVTVFLPGAILPPSARWAFMGYHDWRVGSECLIVSGAPNMLSGADLTDTLGVTGHEKQIPNAMD